MDSDPNIDGDFSPSVAFTFLFIEPFVRLPACIPSVLCVAVPHFRYEPDYSFAATLSAFHLQKVPG